MDYQEAIIQALHLIKDKKTLIRIYKLIEQIIMKSR